VLALIKEKYGEAEVKPKEKISIKDIEKKMEKLQAKKMSDETEVVTDNELTRELMEKYVESVICEGSIVQKIIWK